MNEIKSWTSTSVEDSVAIAKELSSLFKAGDTVLLFGTLGSGKTFLVQKICQFWQVEDDVTSPTFTLIQNYMGDLAVNHMDLYRIETVEELDNLGWEDMLSGQAVTFIEWPQKVEQALHTYYRLDISLADEQRQITLSQVNK